MMDSIVCVRATNNTKATVSYISLIKVLLIISHYTLGQNLSSTSKEMAIVTTAAVDW